MLTRTMLITASVLALAVSDLAAQTVDPDTVLALRQMAIEAGQTSSSAAKPPARSQQAIESERKSIERHGADFFARVSSAKAYVGGEGKEAVSGTAQLVLSPPAPPSPTVDRKTVEALRRMAIEAGQASSSAAKSPARSQEAIDSERQSIERHRADFFSRAYGGNPQS